jgi:uncharacterized membrane protein
MSDDETRPIEPEAPTPPPPAPQAAPATQDPPAPQGAPAQPAYAMPLPPGYPAYAAQQRPRFVDQVLGMRAVVATALACLIVGGLSGFVLGHAAGSDDGGFGRGGFVQQRGAFPGGPNGQAPNQQFGQQFGQGQNGG